MKRTILWASSDVNSIEDFKKMLKKAHFQDCEVLFADTLEQACQQAIVFQPELMITDNLINDADCIQLIEQINQINPNIKVILYCEFKNFNIAVKAFRLGIFDYILKLDNSNYAENLMSRVKRVYEQLEQERQSRQQDAMEQQILRTMKAYASTQLLNQLTHDARPIPYLEEITEFLQIDLLGHQTYTALIFHGCSEILGNQMMDNKIMLSFESAVREWVGSNGIVFRTVNHLFGVIFFDLDTDRFITHQQLLSVIQKYLDAYMKQEKCYLIACVGPTVNYLNHLHRSFRTAESICEEYSFLKKNQVIDFSHKEALQRHLVLPFDQISQLIADIRNKKSNSTAIDDLILYLLSCNHLSHGSLKVIYFMTVYEVECPKSAELSGKKMQFSDAVDRLFQIQTIYDLKQALSWFYQNQLSSSEEQNAVIYQVIQNIQAEFSNPELTLKKVADKLYISPTYLSTVFNKECGCSFKEYLNRFRIEYAKDMLVNSTASITEVSQQSGYNNIQYFTQVFKKQTNTTPTHYRKRYVELTTSKKMNSPIPRS